MLSLLSLSLRLNHFPHQLSGGEQQRVALARALINEPAVVLADEPTGNLDPDNSHDVLDLIMKLNKELSCAFILVTHDLSIADKSPVQYKLADGILQRVK
jgi:lipoprotein-releasing system ATP-binding protein